LTQLRYSPIESLEVNFAIKQLYVYDCSSIVRRVLDHYVLVSGGGIRVSDVTRGEGV